MTPYWNCSEPTDFRVEGYMKVTLLMKNQVLVNCINMLISKWLMRKRRNFYRNNMLSHNRRRRTAGDTPATPTMFYKVLGRMKTAGMKLKEDKCATVSHLPEPCDKCPGATHRRFEGESCGRHASTT